MRFVRPSRVFAVYARWAGKGLQERLNLLVAASFATAVMQAAKKFYYPEIWTKKKEYNRGQRKFKTPRLWWFPVRPTLNFTFAIAGETKGPQYVVTLYICVALMPLYGGGTKNKVCRSWAASILLHRKAGICGRWQGLILFLFGKRNIQRGEPALSWN